MEVAVLQQQYRWLQRKLCYSSLLNMKILLQIGIQIGELDIF